MTQCGKIKELLALFAIQDLSPNATEEVRLHLEMCGSCQLELVDINSVLAGLRAKVINDPGDLFFRRQQNEITGQIFDEIASREAGLLQELADLPVVDPGDAFFRDQRANIQQSLVQTTDEEELGSDDELVACLRELSPADPGELFFRRQAKQIQKAIRADSGQERWRSWTRPIAIAAAVFFLVFGIARISNWQEGPSLPDWNQALQYLAEEELENESGVIEIDDLSPEQLELLASNLEGSIYADSDELFIEDRVDVEDLNDQEIELLIQRMEAKTQT